MKSIDDLISRKNAISTPTILAIIFLLSLSSFIAVWLAQSALYTTIDIKEYLVFHNITEFFSVMVSLSIFGIGWYAYDQSKNKHALFLSCAFLAIGLIDFMHTLSFPGMTPFISPNNTNKAILFWISGRLFSALAFLASALILLYYKDKRWLSKPVLLICALLVSAIAFVAVIFYPAKLPAMFIDGIGLTSFKIYSEYAINVLLTLAFIAYWKLFSRTGEKIHVYFMAALIISIFSELAFTLYQSAFDTYNMLGHVYKVFAFMLIYYGLFKTSVHYPFKKLAESEESLRKSEEQFRTAFEYSASGMLIVALDGKIKRVNQALCAMLVYTREELNGKHFNDITYPEDLDIGITVVRQMLAGERPSVAFEKRYIRRTGEPIWVHISSALLKDASGHPLHFITQIEDITPRKQAEEELRKHRDHLEELVKERTYSLATKTDELNQANITLKEMDKLKSMFIASMSHELRTPLNSIIGFTGMTLQGLSGELNEEQMDNLTRVKKSANHLLSLITDVIDISKIEASRIEINPGPFELSELITEASDTIQPQIKEKSLEFVVNVPSGIKMNTDRKRLLQCILNYLSNAVKFSEAGEVTISAREINGDVEISVMDTGIGIAEHDMSRLFEAFERIDTHLRIKAGGSGLGLYLTKKLATEVLHGSVGVKSTEGKGSTFSLRIPKILPKTGENI